MAEEEQSSAQRWPKWNEPATKGDVIRAMVYQRGVTMKLGSAVYALLSGNNAAAVDAFNQYLTENKDLSDIMDSIGGE